MTETKNGLNPLGWIPLAIGAWVLMFGLYEIAERLWLKNASPDLLRTLHIVRGTVTSFLLAALVAWYHTRRSVSAPSDEVAIKGLRMIVAENESAELAAQARWIVRLRWLAIAGVVVTALIAARGMAVISGFSLLAVLFISTLMAGYNTVFARMDDAKLSRADVAFTNVFLDLTALTLMLYFTGGISNPFFLFYIFHIVIAGILLRKSETYFVTAAACLLFSAVVTLPELGIIRAYPLQNIEGLGFLKTRLGISGVLLAFITTAVCTAYFTTSIVEQLRRRGAQILEAGEILSQERSKTEDIVRNVGAGLLVLDRDTRVVWANEIVQQWFGPNIQGRACFHHLWGETDTCSICPAQCATSPVEPGTVERSAVVGGRQRFFMVTCSPIRSMDGKVDQVLSLIQDITPMKEMEIQVMQAGKMAAVGQLAAGIAHEINNPIAVIASSAEILADQADRPNEPAMRMHLKKIEDNVYRCKDIIRNLLQFSRHEDEGLEEVHICAVLEDTVQLVEGSARARERIIRREYQCSCVTAREDSPLILRHSRARTIQQVILNLLLNALDATDAGGRIAVTASRRDDGIECAISDNGRGMTPEQKSHLFEPFFTTKPVGQGTGLGLYLCHQFVESLRGRIRVESEPERGTTFRVWIPAG